MVWFRSVDCEGYPNPPIFQNTNCFGFDAIPCNGPLYNYDRLVGDVSQEDRSIYFMTGRTPDGRKVIDNDITTIYPWRRDIVATSNEITSYKDLCTRPKGEIVPGITKLGLRLYKSPINGLPPYNDQKCYDCLVLGKNCGTCQGVYGQ